MTFSPDTTIGEMVRRFPATIRAFRQHDVEFCCGGHRTLGDVCRDRLVPFEVLCAELVDGVAQSPRQTTWPDRSASDVADHIVDAFHDLLRHELPRLCDLALGVQGHGDSHRRAVNVIHHELSRFTAELAAQMSVEERELFPRIVRLERGALRSGERPQLEALLREAAAAHADAGQTLRILRQITEGYVPPSTACPSVRALYRGIEDLEALMQLHVHLESNVLFSRASAFIFETGMEKHS